MERQVFHAFEERSPVPEIAGELGRFFDIPFVAGPIPVRGLDSPHG
jgi:hypothetical protein